MPKTAPAAVLMPAHTGLPTLSVGRSITAEETAELLDEDSP